MSSDEIFAAQFWLWPDPAMKRDAQGRLLFINAAFLQLYGGTVEAWTGNVLEGWPAPQPTAPGTYPVPYRFETRIPPQDQTESEQVYDWIEQSLPDGSAFALARNVTPFTQMMAQPPAQHMAAETVQPATDYAYQAPQDMVSIAEVPALETYQQAPPIQDHMMAAEPQGVPPLSEFVNTAPTQPYSVVPEEDYSHVTPEVAQAPAPVAEPAPRSETRDFERRALPLDENSAVLGNNWRDAVIAKALGVESNASEVPKPVSEEMPENTSHVKRILLAEDNAINALLTRTLLEAEGHIVETVEDGLLAVEAMKQQSFDLIFMDMRMPNMDGLESTRKIRTLPNVPRDLPIIALTANAFDDDRNACFDSGMNDFMTKPVSAEELSQMVKTWTGPKEEKNAA